MGFKEWIIPQDRYFYDLFSQQVEQVKKGIDQFRAMLDHWNDLENQRIALRAIEQSCDEIVHQIFERLNRTFITPIDREDMASLARSLDDVLDFVHAAGNRLFFYRIREPTAVMRSFADLLTKQIDQLVPAIQGLRGRRGFANLPSYTVEIHRLENEADRLLNRSIGDLFNTENPVDIIKLKDVYEALETATDRCEDVADVLNDILRKHA